MSKSQITDPEKLKLVIWPSLFLEYKCDEVEQVNDYIVSVCNRMKKVLKSMPNGIGLAASQVGFGQRIYVAYENPEDDNSEIVAYINPEFDPEDILHPELAQEGCLSLPGVLGDVLRPTSGTLTYLNESGENQVEKVDGLKARCAQHEIDHLDGICLTDSMTEASKKKAAAAVARLMRMRRK